MTTSWQPGQAVLIFNLRSQWLNGQVATVVRQGPEKGKWLVRLQKDAKEVGYVGAECCFCWFVEVCILCISHCGFPYVSLKA